MNSKKNIGGIMRFTKLEPYSYAQIEHDLWTVYKYDSVVAHYSTERDAKLTTELLNNEILHQNKLTRRIEYLTVLDDSRREYQRLLESKISILKDRINQLEKRGK